MFGFFSNRRKKRQPGTLMQELWTMRTGFFGNPRFEPTTGNGYSASADKGGLALALERENLFAWMENPDYRYRDFVLDAEVEIDRDNGYSSIGFMFRQTGESEYYYFLISSRGYLRFDLVLNGSPEEILGWTRLTTGAGLHYTLRIIADGPAFTFFVNGAWAGDVEDDRLDAGTISFCAQNYGDKDTGVFRCRRLTLESRPVEVSRSNTGGEAPRPAAEMRRNLAESFAASGRCRDQVRQLQHLVVKGKASAEDFYRCAEGFIHMNMYTRALQDLEKCLTLDPSHAPARLARADMLYLTNRISRLETLLPDLVRDFPDNAFLLNLAGNTAFAAEEWAAAADYYLRAADGEPGMPLYLEHAARAAERQGAVEDSRDLYVRAATGFFRNEEYDEAARIMEILETAGALSSEMLVLKGKLLFQEGNLSGALAVFEELLGRGCRDGSVFFLSGLILSSRGEREKAREYFRSAVNIEDDYYLYWFRLAENAWLLGEDCSRELAEALDLAPEDGWVLNLAGQVSMDAGDYGRAADYLRKGLKALPEEPDVRINLAEALFRGAHAEDALEVLREGMDDPAVLNHRGNLLSRMGRFEAAVEAYTAASRREPENMEYRENCAAGYLEMDMPLKAEEILSAVIDEKPNGRAFNLMGNSLGMTGEHKRAEAAYREALRLIPGWDEPALNLAELYLTLGAADEAEAVLEGLQTRSSSRLEKLKSRLHRLTTETISCSSCGREWTVPRNLGDQGSLRITGEPPEDLPAGICPSCGRIYCIRCASGRVENSRFLCSECGDYLKLQDDRLKYLLKKYLDDSDVDTGTCGV